MQDRQNATHIPSSFLSFTIAAIFSSRPALLTMYGSCVTMIALRGALFLCDIVSMCVVARTVTPPLLVVYSFLLMHSSNSSVGTNHSTARYRRCQMTTHTPYIDTLQHARSQYGPLKNVERRWVIPCAI
jgi:hypothetical protein